MIAENLARQVHTPTPFQPQPPRRGMLRAVIAEMRPRQWIKNTLVLAPLLFSHRALELDSLTNATLALLGYCLLASGVYVFNDLADRERDRHHPTKCRRPIASGDLSVPIALVLGVLLLAGSIALFSSLGARVFGCALGYLALQVAYTTFLKRVAILDVIVIAAGFVLRVITGALAISVPISSWLYLCTLLLALFLGFAKRRAELVLLKGDAVTHRANLQALSRSVLDQFLTVLAASTIVCYALYTMSQETVRRAHGEGMMLTLPCVVYGLLRYLQLVDSRGEGGSTEKLLLSDWPLIADALAFVAISAGVLYF